MTISPPPLVVRVIPDVPAIHKEFDYSVPADWHGDGRAERLAVGAMVRIELHGRRVGGWVGALDPLRTSSGSLKPLAKVSGVGPPPELIDLCRWAAHRWAGPLAGFLRTASPPKLVSSIGVGRVGTEPVMPVDDLVVEAFTGAGAVVQVPPLGDRWPLILGAVAEGNALILVPSTDQASLVAGRLRRAGVSTAVHPRDWAAGAAGATVVGGRTAALAPVADLAAIVMIDEHDEVYQSERAPTWHAREVLIERAARAGVPVVLTSPMPTPEARTALPLVTASRTNERAGWPQVRVVDPSTDGSSRGTLWTEAAVRLLRTPGRVAVVINRKGRSRLLACANCEALAVCTECDAAMRQPGETELVCAAHGHVRPVVCSECGATRFKNLRIGVTRAAEELAALLREPVVEVTGETNDGSLAGARVFVGTEAVLHRIDTLEAVIFADFDQELVAPRYRAGEQALALLVRAGRLVGSRRDGTGEVLVQTRQPRHPVVQAAVAANIEPWITVELARRRILRYPPYAALAEVSGAGAAQYMERLGTPPGVNVLGPVDEAWLVRADTPSVLADALAEVERPKGRMRIAVDPLRI